MVLVRAEVLEVLVVLAEVLEAETKVINVVLGVGGVPATLAVPLVPGVADHAADAAHEGTLKVKAKIKANRRAMARLPGLNRRSRSTTPR